MRASLVIAAADSASAFVVPSALAADAVVVVAVVCPADAVPRAALAWLLVFVP